MSLVSGCCMSQRYQHDHDEELGMYWYSSPAPPERPVVARLPPKMRPALKAESDAAIVARLTNAAIRWRRPRRRDRMYWAETGRLVLEYFELQAGADYSDVLRDGFIGWLKRSPRELALYVSGDDTARAMLVDWFLSIAP